MQFSVKDNIQLMLAHLLACVASVSVRFSAVRGIFRFLAAQN